MLKDIHAPGRNFQPVAHAFFQTEDRQVILQKVIQAHFHLLDEISALTVRSNAHSCRKAVSHISEYALLG
jgi:hypothetical protein